ncbi:family transcriptional regulator : Two component transcriptional regulator, LuxR family OS=Methylocella silvestris (strain BL2 / DSM 15510 / NCIMB 13906) GN=Msil_2019 PE=4 SV=1: Response_reg: GerE [Gemmata massiliana]|uniref:Response regulatory domain-containing protein n=1 Tax=Gemmata massiliana TaxID=1210884 RepID=A0A6P2CV48_9BACT|nr:response regulator transcription factor [Gemmata massiliana]VTR92851.1 family transcriptional regulator : Two component transcriptional regulator, LuxR family OS=Methylocella silvestris (strain BL2 / DSM 15510 / NCIMB 13906) GN=Msil_2019 PE=4 SV=1: Response_reg: GerE [Gemmata massiliana]
MNRIRVFLADDHAVVREGLRSLINSQLDMEVIGEAADGAEAVSRAVELAPDVVVTDVSMLGLNGAQVTEHLRAARPGQKVLVLTVHEDKEYLRRLLEAGAVGYILKRAASADLVSAIRAVAEGGTYLDPSLAGSVVDNFIRPAPEPIPADLSQREEEVVRLIALGYSNKEIAAQLKLSVKTVETYKARSMEKLQIESRVGIVRYALRRGWLTEPNEETATHP